MARIACPNGYTSWNNYIESQVSGISDINVRRLAKRDIKLSMIAQVERQTVGNSYRDYNIYETPGTNSPNDGHPWELSIMLTDESGNIITDENGNILVLG